MKHEKFLTIHSCRYTSGTFGKDAFCCDGERGGLVSSLANVGEAGFSYKQLLLM